ncbi:MAG: dihydropteroate synthase [Verrucomicrobiota bacterium]
MRWCGQRFGFQFPRPALVLGVLNVTPDSFSDGGLYRDPGRAVERAHQLVAEGADLIDVGGESTRPGAEPVDDAEELARVVPVVERLCRELKVPVSIDTRKPSVAERCLDLGVAVVNDIGANREDPALWRIVARHQSGYVAMHMQGDPGTMQVRPEYRDVVDDVVGFLEDRLVRVQESGVTPDQVVLDPGIGFGKSLDHNLSLLAHIDRFQSLTRPVLLGVSRKSFLGRVLGVAETERLPGALACSVWAASRGVQLFRTHDVAPTVQALRTLEALSASIAPVP